MRKFTIKFTKDSLTRYLHSISLEDIVFLSTTDKSVNAAYYNEEMIDSIIAKLPQLIAEYVNLKYFGNWSFEKVEETGEYIIFEDFINSDNAMDKYYEKHDGMYLLKLNDGEIVTAELNWYQGRGNNYRFESDDLRREFFADDIKKIAFLKDH